MSYKFRITGPICFVLVVALIVGYFCFTTWAAVDGASASDSGAVAVETQTTENLSASVPVEETLVDAVADNDVNQEASIVLSDGTGYELTDSERIAVECAVMCEAGGEGVEGQMMVAQSILDGCVRNSFNAFQTISKYQIHSTSYSNVTDEVRESVSRVFDDGERITEEMTDLWYNPALVESEWHELQEYVITVGSHRFFWMNDDMDT